MGFLFNLAKGGSTGVSYHDISATPEATLNLSIAAGTDTGVTTFDSPTLLAANAVGAVFTMLVQYHSTTSAPLGFFPVTINENNGSGALLFDFNRIANGDKLQGNYNAQLASISAAISPQFNYRANNSIGRANLILQLSLIGYYA